MLIVEEDRAYRGLVLLQKVLDIGRVAPRRDVRELGDVAEAWELQLGGPVKRPESRYKPLMRVRISYRVNLHQGHPT